MGEVNRLLELLSNIPSEIKEFVTTGRSFSSLGVESMAQGKCIVFNKKKHLYSRQLNFDIRGFLLAVVVGIFYCKVLDNIIDKFLIFIQRGVVNLNTVIITKLGIWVIFLFLSYLYHYSAFRRWLFGFNRADEFEMLKCSLEPLVLLTIYQLPIVAYIIKKDSVLMVKGYLICLGILGLNILAKVILIHRNDILRSRPNERINLGTDVKIIANNNSVRVVDLTTRNLYVTKEDNIYIVPKNDNYEIKTLTIRKEAIKFIEIGNRRVVYKEGRWKEFGK